MKQKLFVFYLTLSLVSHFAYGVQNKYQETKQQAITGSNPRKCEDIRGFCRDESDCKMLLDSCYTEYAKVKSDPSACANIQSASMVSCYQIYAHEKIDIKSCEYIRTSPYFNPKDYGQCILSVQHERGKFSLQDCSKLQEFGAKSYFRDCIVSLVQQTKDGSLCEKYVKEYENGFGFQDCMKMASSLEPGITKPATRQLKEISEQAIQESNPKHCEELKECSREHQCGMLIDSCYREYADKKLDLPSCQKIQNGFIKYSCYSRYAVAKNDISACEGLKNVTDAQGSSYYGPCMNLVQGELKSYSVENCLKIKDSSKGHFVDCIREMVMQVRDTSLCEKYLRGIGEVIGLEENQLIGKCVRFEFP